MQKNNFYRVSLTAPTLLQIGLSALDLNFLSRIDNWSAVYAEDSRGYLLVADYLSGKEIPAGEQPLMRYPAVQPPGALCRITPGKPHWHTSRLFNHKYPALAYHSSAFL